MQPNFAFLQLKCNQMNNKIFNFSLIAISIFLCTACFDLHEEILFNKNGSGNFTFKIDMSQLKTFFESDNGFTQTSATKEKNNPTDKLDSKFDAFKNQLSQIEGISNIKQNLDTTNIIVSISFDFKNITALNNGMSLLFNDDIDTDKKIKQKQTIFYAFNNNQLIRYETENNSGFLKAGLVDKNAPIDKNNLSQQLIKADDLFKTVSYTTTYQFENEIKEYTNKNSTVSSNKKKIILKCYPFVEDSIKQMFIN
jgi:hypothetical protein